MKLTCLRLMNIILYLGIFYNTHGSSPLQDDIVRETTVAKHLNKISDLNKHHSQKKHVVILGGGIAGLTAAYELTNLGHTVEIIEASNRYGGRIWTHTFKSGEYGELGAMRIPASHDYARHYIKIADLKLRPFITVHDNPNCFYHLRGQPPIRIRDVRRFIEKEYQLSSHEQRFLSSKLPPAILGVHLVNSIKMLHSQDKTNEFETDDWGGLFGASFPNDYVRDLEKVSLEEFLEERLGSADAKELIGTTTGLESWWDKSVTMFLREGITETGIGLEEIVGGFSKLPNSLVGILKKRKVVFHPNTAVISIEVSSDAHQKITLKTRQTDPHYWDCPPIKEASLEQKKADYVLCTLPFSVLRTMELKGFSPSKMEAIRNLGYLSANKVLLNCKKRFWEQSPREEDRIVGGASISDQITRFTYYPSDHAGSQSLSTSEKNEFTTVFTTSTPQKIGISESFSDPSNSNPGVLLASYNWGLDALRLGTCAPDDQLEIVLTELEKFHPEIRQNIDRDDPMKSIFWDSYRWSRGAFCAMRPGDMTKYHHTSRKSEGNLFFAGEHCSLEPAWIQGAIKSALDAVEEIIKADPN
jgi:monoamine oxidase